jgi:hypothetical protein
MARKVADDVLRKVIRQGSWKFEVYNRLEYHTDRVVLPGDGTDDVDSVLAFMDSHPVAQTRLDIAGLGIVGGSGGSEWRDMTRDDVVAFRTIYVQEYGDVDKPNVYVPLESLPT